MPSTSSQRHGFLPESPFGSRSTLTPFLAVLVLLASRAYGFQCSPLLPIHHHHTTFVAVDTTHAASHEPSTRLSARANRRKSNTAAFYSSNTADTPPLSSDNVKSFGKRMRDLALRQQGRTSKKKGTTGSKINPAKPSFVEEAVSLQQYKKLVADEPERLVVVRFYAKWCKACKAAEPLFYRMAHSLKDDNDVLFVEVPVLEENANLHQGLGVPALPFAHIYSPSLGLVEELRMCKQQFKNFQNVVKTYKDGSCDVEMDPETGLFLSPFVEKQEQSSN